MCSSSWKVVDLVFVFDYFGCLIIQGGDLDWIDSWTWLGFDRLMDLDLTDSWTWTWQTHGLDLYLTDLTPSWTWLGFERLMDLTWIWWIQIGFDRFDGFDLDLTDSWRGDLLCLPYNLMAFSFLFKRSVYLE